MNFSDFDVVRRTRKGNFLNQVDHLIGWASIEKAIGQHYAPQLMLRIAQPIQNCSCKVIPIKPRQPEDKLRLSFNMAG
ncbi:hypothetical protein SAMN05216419_102029 [Nitrosomonas cryotolerans]|uniref:Uncharacterized protein n=1 Tax=Nitrosomonas cryotolerans ATCC 49181 TaxID=1131553 RepID=A0A1N6H848_9PROT|nr:hypothetical protein [Nitrosomonas cryotolerans]SFP79772.1 hypothetical protein SAMN05216419_102029 [Nitrosomonas cryotolerans]SIO15964.1 hypothetical protein SAMN02743940_1069 [Nitrosomonas cryotolerans ATCC 49181]